MNIWHVFLLGVIVTTSLVAALLFLKYWRRTRDFLFLAFAIAFAVEALNRFAILMLHPGQEGAPSMYPLRLLTFILILAAIVKKSTGERRS
ncbi:MAG TPA: DUF5985 family protein [Terriglobales bacterium]|nr:DUF5985 family protein [Terriglobales bacterium]